MSDNGVDRLAAQLGRPPTTFPALAELSPEQIELLRGAIEATRERRRRELDDALRRALPGPLGALGRALLRRPR